MHLPGKGRYVVFASTAGADDNPAWYYNLLAQPDTRIEVGDQIINVQATELHGRERDDSYAEQARRYPAFDGCQQGTPRTIPVIALTPTG